jgi:hypothetical protein
MEVFALGTVIRVEKMNDPIFKNLVSVRRTIFDEVKNGNNGWR